MEIELKEINLNIEVIKNLFRMFENKKMDMTPFKGGLPKVPLIVGLIFGVPDNINNLISKFVLVKPLKFMKEMKFYIRHHNRHLREQRQFFYDLGFEVEGDDIINDENSLTFIESSLTGIKNNEWGYQEYLNEQRITLDGFGDSDDDDD